ncbi:hypothetical protein VNO78_22721 [Psophocarpus tetragonolobus]|uniref:Uncharacterized protein n=1 Tax=Psophocarpus tetragonolobus TaxID=3891 RepID=A0AAN9S2C2_PSOTE
MYTSCDLQLENLSLSNINRSQLKANLKRKTSCYHELSFSLSCLLFFSNSVMGGSLSWEVPLELVGAQTLVEEWVPPHSEVVQAWLSRSQLHCLPQTLGYHT